jgi:hypothetical protein
MDRYLQAFLSIVGYPWDAKSNEIEIWAFPYQDANMLITTKMIGKHLRGRIISGAMA